MINAFKKYNELQNNHKNSHAKSPKDSEDIIDAEYTVINDEKTNK